jgi:murein DD-endopeptidase MepM/ murein hydrolase activator NlpD
MRRPLIFAGLALALPGLAACMPDTPRTMLSWDAIDSLTPHSIARVTSPAAAPAKPKALASARTYVYQGDTQGAPVPTPRVTQSALPPAAVSPNPAFVWPVNGKVISSFGTTNGGERNDGINIAAAQGTPIHAAAGGTVSYAGDELKDYGNLVLIKHADGYITAYAHADRLIVAKGETVTKGQVIGYAGHTGDVSTPQLHFEIRRGTQPVDPSSLLEGRSS